MSATLLYGAGLALLSLAAGVGVAAWLARRMLRRLRHLEAVAAAVRAGELDSRSMLDGDDEPARLSRAIDAMLDAQAATNLALAESEARHRLALDAGRLGAWRWNIASGNTDWLSEREVLLGPRPAEGWPDFRQMVVDEDRADFLEAGRSVIQGERAEYEARFRLRRTDGRVVHLFAHGRLVRDAQGQPVAMIGVTEDVTVETAAAAQLAASEAFAQRLFDANPDALLLVDGQGVVRRANDRAFDLLGQPALTGRCVDDLVPQSMRERHRSMRQELTDRLLMSKGGSATLLIPPRGAAGMAGPGALSGESQRALSMNILRPDGAQRPVSATLSTVAQAGETLVIVSLHDMTEETALRSELLRHREHLEDLVRQRTLELEQSRARAEQLSRAKSDFLAQMSHEVRTPLNAILGMAQLGRDASGSGPDRRRWTEVVRAGEHLLSIVNDVLDVARLEAGRFELARGPVALRSLLRDTAEWFRAQAAEKGLHLDDTVADSVPPTILGDERRLRQILVNLLSNAIKFTERGEVRLRAAVLDGWLYLKVLDSGPGMDADMVARLFRPFEQADASLARRFGGSGLGLSISQSLAHLMGGEITVETAPGAGSAFTLSLPFEACDEPEPQPGCDAASSRLPLQGLRLLVVDDVEVNRIVAEAMLQQSGAEVLLAHSAEEALELVRTAAAGSLHAVLMDVQMPGMDGLEATRRLALLAPGLPVVGLTAFATEDDRERCLQAGMVAQISKPVAIGELVSVVQSVMREASPGREAPPGREAAPGRKAPGQT